MERNLVYFAYGSNLDVEQMARRCPDSVVMSTAILPRHRLVFTGYSKGWGGPLATVIRADHGLVEGLLYRIPLHSMPPLDWYEGHPALYRRVRRKVVDGSGIPWRAHVYVRPLDGRERRPGGPYLRVIRRAYEKFGFDLSALSGPSSLGGHRGHGQIEQPTDTMSAAFTLYRAR